MAQKLPEPARKNAAYCSMAKVKLYDKPLAEYARENLRLELHIVPNGGRCGLKKSGRLWWEAALIFCVGIS
jgi:hypothetical protein